MSDNLPQAVGMLQGVVAQHDIRLLAIEQNLAWMAKGIIGTLLAVLGQVGLHIYGMVKKK